VCACLFTASALGLLDAAEQSTELMLAVKIQDFMRFLLEHLTKEVKEYRELKPELKDPRDNKLAAAAAAETKDPFRFESLPALLVC
jgi:hypothetical protein